MQRITSALIVGLAGIFSGLSQEFRSSISGRVVDPQKAVVPFAKVAAVEVQTGFKSETVTGADGRYSLPFLLPGLYRIEAEAQGFKRLVREGIRVSTNERLAIDLTLEVGQLVDSVTVTADAPIVESATASLGQVVGTRQIEDLPMNGRTPLALAALAYGVVPQQPPGFYRPYDNSGVSDFSIGGAPTQTNELLLDGSPNATRDGRSAYSPPVDAVLELKVEAFQADAAYGHTGGGTVNVATRGGTNTYHGTLYEFNQVSRLAATPFFTNRAGLKKGVSRYNQWGFTLGGPVVIPRLVDGHNKLFFYFGFEGLVMPDRSPRVNTVPTDAEWRGDFSQLLALGSQYQIYDPLTGIKEGSRIRRQPFPGNIIPSGRLNATALKYREFYPPPTGPGTIDGRNNYAAVNTIGGDTYVNEVARVDLNLSDAHKLFANFRHNNRDNTGPGAFENFATGRKLIRVNWGGMLDDVYTISPRTVLNTRLNWTRFTEIRRRKSNGIDLTTLGFPGYMQAGSPRTVVPRVDIGGFTSVGDDAGLLTPWDIFHVLSSVTNARGKHNLKAGADLRLNRESSINYGYSAGRFTFGTNWTRGPLDSSSSAPLGQELAAFLLGLPTAGTLEVNAARTAQSGYYALFLQDDYRVRPDLTLNLGLRYEKELPTTERFNRVVNGFDPSSPNSVTSPAMAAYAKAPIPEIAPAQFRPVGGLLFAGPGNRDIYRTSSHNFSPRFGFAWAPAALGPGRTVLRGGAGVFFYAIGVSGINQTGFSQTTSMVPTLDGYLTVAATFSNPFASTGIQQPTGAALGLDTFLGKSISFYNTHALNPYSIRWNFDIQRLLARNLVLEVGYIGNHSVHSTVDRDLSFVPRQYLSTLPYRDQATIDHLSANVTNPFFNLLPGSTLNGSTVARSQLLVQYPQFTGVTLNAANEGSSYFHMLLVRMDKRLAHGVQFQANYQYSKLLARISRLNPSDPHLEKRVADEDRPHRLVVNAVFELPFGRGKAFGSSVGPLWNRLIGGWRASGLYTIQSGAALRWGNVIYYGGDIRLNPRGVDGAFDTTRFNTNSRQQLAFNIRTFPSRFGDLRADKINTMDLSLIKQTALREKWKIEFRCEFFNALNHPQFSAPDLSPTSSAFGKITSQANLPRVTQLGLKVVW